MKYKQRQLYYLHKKILACTFVGFLILPILAVIGEAVMQQNNATNVGSSSYVFSSLKPACLYSAHYDTAALKKQPLVLCYHQIRDWLAGDSEDSKTYIVTPKLFCEQMQLLYNNGFHAILPGQWLDHVLNGTQLPGNAFLLTFDDGTESQINNALPQLDRYGFKATFFVMTVTLDKPRYMSRRQVRYLSDQGHEIGCHTWDHHDMTRYTEADWYRQLEQPTRLLEQVTGRKIHYFAYPFGLWNSKAISRIKACGYLAAFQLGGRADNTATEFTIRRILVDGHWTTSRFMSSVVSQRKI